MTRFKPVYDALASELESPSGPRCRDARHPRRRAGGLAAERPELTNSGVVETQDLAVQVFILERRRATAWLWSWQTRDSLTPRISPISLRFISCS